MQENKTLLMIRKAVTRGNDESIRYISNERYEIFVQDEKKPSTLFDSILQDLIKDTDGADEYETYRFQNTLPFWRNCVLESAVEGAQKALISGNDERIYAFGNFSIIVTYSKAQAQIPHIDVWYPSHQFNMCMSQGSKSTIMYIPKEQIRDISEIKTRVLPLMPDRIVQACNKDSLVCDLLAKFGSLLHSSFYRYESKDLNEVGVVEMIPGNMIHGGPATVKDYRASLFFSGWPQDSCVTDLYDCETQYSAPTLMVEIAHQIGHELDRDSYSYLLLMIGEYTKANAGYLRGKYRLANHFSHLTTKSEIVQFLEALEQCIRKENPRFDQNGLNHLVVQYTDMRFRDVACDIVTHPVTEETNTPIKKKKTTTRKKQANQHFPKN